tara:strand:- start:513 stop:674 length:162 start_codon:yes stop_codon:yes gene_type:complete
MTKVARTIVSVPMAGAMVKGAALGQRVVMKRPEALAVIVVFLTARAPVLANNP